MWRSAVDAFAWGVWLQNSTYLISGRLRLRHTDLAASITEIYLRFKKVTHASVSRPSYLDSSGRSGDESPIFDMPLKVPSYVT